MRKSREDRTSKGRLVSRLDLRGEKARAEPDEVDDDLYKDAKTLSSSELSAEEYEVEKIVGKRVHNGGVQYCIKWVGYPDSANTWQDVDTMDCAQLIEEFERSHRPTSPRRVSSSQSRPSQTTSHPQEALKRSTRDRRNKTRRDPYADLPKGDWEDQVLKVETVARDSEGQLVVWLNWRNGTSSQAPAGEANVRCPQKIIAFYESRLKFPGENKQE